MKSGHKYSKLYEYFMKNKSKQISLSRSQIEKIVGFSLPKSSNMRTWWSNSPEDGHSQAFAWKNAGYRVSVGDYDLLIFNKIDD